MDYEMFSNILVLYPPNAISMLTPRMPSSEDQKCLRGSLIDTYHVLKDVSNEPKRKHGGDIPFVVDRTELKNRSFSL